MDFREKTEKALNNVYTKIYTIHIYVCVCTYIYIDILFIFSTGMALDRAMPTL